MSFTDIIASAPAILAEGAVIERLKRDGRFPLDPHVLHAGWPYDRHRRALLEEIWRGYLAIGREFDLPMIVLAPTWRASSERVAAAGLKSVRDVNVRGVRMLAGLRDELGDYGRHVFIGGIIGPRGDAYNPAEALTTHEACSFHRPQIRALAEADPDFLQAATLPALSEAIGISEAMNETGCPGIISFVLLREGTLLDGTPLSEAVARLDREPHSRPFAYMVNCTHPAFFHEAMEREVAKLPALRERVIGLQANTAALSPEQLDDAPAPVSQDPESFADAMIEVHRRFSTKILGGCCGTDHRHMRAIAERIRKVIVPTGS
ncbi:homocysteine S-methyltransferase family protein [bacterium]|nr:homocysteine S-methyltransferase family protein [bacterium]MBU1983001.1 homocysteine S-methyltransferase family protein [bacterium]